MRGNFDLDRYPLDRPRSEAWRALVTRCKADLARDGMFNLDMLLKPDAAAALVADLTPGFATRSFRHEREHNIYFADRVPGLEDDHPALRRFRTENRTLCGDQVRGSVIEWLYHWPEFAEFLSAAMDKPALYPMQDELAGLNVMSYDQGQALSWHFDRSEFTTTMLLQAPHSGGEFLYRTDLRSDDDPNFDGVARLLRGEDPHRKSLTLKPGTLNVFRGKNTPHCTAPVEGPRARVICVFSFYEAAGVQFSDDERLGFYGRTR